MLTKVMSCAVVGVDAVPVDIQVDVAPGEFSYRVVGLAARSVEEGRERILAALDTLEEEPPLADMAVCPTSADPKGEGGGFDLPILLGLLGARLSLAPLHGLLVLGKLRPNGTLRAVKGTLPAARLARSLGLRGVLIPRVNAHEAVVVDGIEVYCADHLREIVDALKGKAPLPLGDHKVRGTWWPSLDMPRVCGHATARTALEISAAGGHNVLMVGGPGSVTGQLARSISTILPAMTQDESLETMNVYSSVGLAEGGLFVDRPFRFPHHTINRAALVGGGRQAQPGEISLSHNGVLCLLDLQEFSSGAIRSLREPLERRALTLHRKSNRVVLPASFSLVASAHPCPCGRLDSGSRECTCSEASLTRYRAKMSGSVLDWFDLRVPVRTIERADSPPTPSERSEVVRARVASAWARQQTRLAPWGLRRNAEMSREALAATCTLDRSGKAALAEVSRSGRALTARSRARVLRVARTIADLREQDAIDAACLFQAATYRALEAGARPTRGPARRTPTRTLGSLDGSRMPTA
jgi:magnesium chelatase family protein